MKSEEDLTTEFLKIVTSFKHHLFYLKSSGIDRILTKETNVPKEITGQKDSIFSAKKGYSPLEDVGAEIKNCRRCKLHTLRKNLVFGKGNSSAELVFVGEAPGEDEDLKGEPFVGESGQLLTRIIQSIRLKREDVYITNIIKCRPPNNRNPQIDEIESCKPFLVKQLKAIRPRIICTLGSFAAQTLLKTTESISSLRGKSYQFGKMKLIPTYHPAYLLRNPRKKREVWKDMQRIEKEYFGEC